MSSAAALGGWWGIERTNGCLPPWQVPRSPMATAHRTHIPTNACRTPLHSAASRDCAEVIRLLAQGGANLEARAADGRCAGWPSPQKAWLVSAAGTT